MLLKFTIDIIVQQFRLLSKWLVKVEGAVCSMHIISIQRNTLPSSSVNLRTDDTHELFCVCLRH